MLTYAQGSIKYFWLAKVISSSWLYGTLHACMMPCGAPLTATTYWSVLACHLRACKCPSAKQKQHRQGLA